jgi:hypothetical protein
MIKFFTSVAIAVLVALPAKAAAPNLAETLLSMRSQVSPPDTVIVECEPGPTQAGLDVRFQPAAFVTKTASGPLCPRFHRGTMA